jgi:glycosyltransferase involved in cell wall biosynthesis
MTAPGAIALDEANRVRPGPARIRVLHVITRLVKGGAQENTLATVTGISGPMWENRLAAGPAQGPEGSLEPECIASGVPLLRVPALVRELSPRSDLQALRQLMHLLRRERPHIVHTHTSKAGILGRIAARRVGVPAVVHTPHGHVFQGFGGRLKTELFVRMERACAPMADRLIALTDAEQREHLELGIGRPAQWHIVHSGVDLAPFHPCWETRQIVRAALGLPADATVVGTVGRLVPIKGHCFLLNAFARLAAKQPGLHLLLVGDGPLRDDLIARARSLHLCIRQPGQPIPISTSGPGAMHLVGLRRDIPQLLTAMDLFVLPSLNEGMGRVLVEAMATELPCIASRVSGIPDVVAADVTGLLVPPRDPEALASAILTLLNEPARAREMGRRGRDRVVPAFGVEPMVGKLEVIYRELLQEKGLLPPPSAGGSRFLTGISS